MGHSDCAIVWDPPAHTHYAFFLRGREDTHYASHSLGGQWPGPFGSDFPIRFQPSLSRRPAVLREGGASGTSPAMAGAGASRARACFQERPAHAYLTRGVLLSSLSQLRGGRGRSPGAAAARGRGARGWRRTAASAGGRPSSCSTRPSGSRSASVSSSHSSSTRCSSISSPSSCVASRMILGWLLAGPWIGFSIGSWTT